jgi:hypothetical protein
VSTFWNCTRKPSKRNCVMQFGCSKVKGSSLVCPN